jgi:predicted permease
VAQLLTENLVIALAGGVAGILAAFLLTDLLVALAPPGTPRVDELAVNGRVLAFAASVTLLAGLFFGLLPAIKGAGGSPQDALREGGRGGSRAAGGRTRQLLVVAQVSLALVLLVGSGLLVQSFRNLRTIDLGFRPDGVLSFRVTPPVARYPDAQAAVAFHEQLEEALAALPGVESVGATSALPLAGFDSDQGFAIEGRPAPPPDQPQGVWFRVSTPAFLETAGIEIVRGRGLEAADDGGSVPVVVVNETLAGRYFPGEDPIGRRLNMGRADAPEWWQIVGVARDVKHFSVRGEARNALYAPLVQWQGRTMFHVVRSERDAESLVPEVRATIASLDPELAAGQIAPLSELVGSDLAPDRFVTMLVSLFAMAAVTLAVVGLYGVVSYDVSTRLREMGVRLALGAQPRAVGVLVLRRSLQVVAVGLVLGLLGSAVLARFMESLLYDVGAADPLSLVGGSLLLASAAGLAALIPARRAGRVDPVEVLRSE